MSHCKHNILNWLDTLASSGSFYWSKNSSKFLCVTTFVANDLWLFVVLDILLCKCLWFDVTCIMWHALLRNCILYKFENLFICVFFHIAVYNTIDLFSSYVCNHDTPWPIWMSSIFINYDIFYMYRTIVMSFVSVHFHKRSQFHVENCIFVFIWIKHVFIIPLYTHNIPCK